MSLSGFICDDCFQQPSICNWVKNGKLVHLCPGCLYKVAPEMAQQINNFMNNMNKAHHQREQPTRNEKLVSEDAWKGRQVVKLIRCKNCYIFPTWPKPWTANPRCHRCNERLEIISYEMHGLPIDSYITRKQSN